MLRGRVLLKGSECGLEALLTTLLSQHGVMLPPRYPLSNASEHVRPSDGDGGGGSGASRSSVVAHNHTVSSAPGSALLPAKAKAHGTPTASPNKAPLPHTLSVSAEEKENSALLSLLDSSGPSRDFLFVRSVLRTKQSVFFNEVLLLWKAIVDTAARPGSAHVASAFFDLMSLREIQLLNSKLNDEDFTCPKMSLPCCPSDFTQQRRQTTSATHGIAERWGLDEDQAAWDDTALYGTGSHPAVHPTEKTVTVTVPPGELFRFYSAAHFAAELGSVQLLRFLAEQLRPGLTMASHPYTNCTHVPPYVAPVLESSPPATPACVSFDWVGCRGMDYTGSYMSHCAARAGSVDVLAFLVARFGADLVLLQQRQGPSLRPNQWGPSLYMKGLTPGGAALAVGQTVTLEWLNRHHPQSLTLPHADLRNALVSAALQDCSAAFAFAWHHDLLPLHEVSVVEDAAEVLRSCVLDTAYFAAAEAGSATVLDWFVDTFGEGIVECVRDSHGATVLHHCARGGQAAVLRALLQRAAKSAYGGARLVDTPDNRGRTPAMWCVMGSGRKGKRVVDTLEALREAGSSWAAGTAENQRTLLGLARRHHAPHSKVWRYLQRLMK